MGTIKNIFLFPRVKYACFQDAIEEIRLPIFLKLSNDLECLRPAITESFQDVFTLRDNEEDFGSRAAFRYDASVPREGYELRFGRQSVVTYSDASGAFYALVTLKQLLKNPVKRNAMIKDAPDLKIRGFMLDVSRAYTPDKSGIFIRLVVQRERAKPRENDVIIIRYVLQLNGAGFGRRVAAPIEVVDIEIF